MTRGCRLYVEGRIRYSTYEKFGKTHYQANVFVGNNDSLNILSTTSKVDDFQGVTAKESAALAESSNAVDASSVQKKQETISNDVNESVTDDQSAPSDVEKEKQAASA